ncbi:MAG: PQQ-binding-like beta-propeller repeat protein [Planctomycetota bacterium]|nr:PQQ-binding-like beta-propeller repeat protein [Planctomycetota bacterium]
MNRQKHTSIAAMRMCTCLIAATVLSLLLVSVTSAGQWPRFRGPNGQGISDAKAIPAKWTQSDYRWKIKLPGDGPSSPVVWDEKVFVTCADKSVAKGILVAVDGGTGKTLWKKEYALSRFKMSNLNSYAAGTPALADDRIYILWPTAKDMLLVTLDHAGNEIWQKDFGPITSVHGPGISPIVVDDLLVFAREQKSSSGSVKSAWMAVDRNAGQTRWIIPRQGGAISYSTPCLHRPRGGAAQLVFTSQAHGITAVDPGAGRIIWEADSAFNARVVSSPVIVGDLIAGTCGQGGGGKRLTVIRPPALPGDPAKEAYSSEDRASGAIPYVSTSLCKDGLLFSCHDQGTICCRRATTGEILWSEKPAGRYYGSPVWVDGRLYCITRDGDVVVVKAAPEYELLSVNTLGEKSDATPAVADDKMYLRTASHLICIGGDAK